METKITFDSIVYMYHLVEVCLETIVRMFGTLGVTNPEPNWSGCRYSNGVCRYTTGPGARFNRKSIMASMCWNYLPVDVIGLFSLPTEFSLMVSLVRMSIAWLLQVDHIIWSHSKWDNFRLSVYSSPLLKNIINRFKIKFSLCLLLLYVCTVLYMLDDPCSRPLIHSIFLQWMDK